MKSIGWATLCGGVGALGTALVKSGDFYSGLAILIASLMLSAMTILYVALYVVIPFDAAMEADDSYWDKRLKDKSGIAYFVEASKVYWTRKGMFYATVTMAYAIYALTLGDYLVANVLTT